MPGKLSNSGADAALNAALGLAPAGNRYLALCSTAPTNSALGTEVATPGQNGYTRQQVTFAAPADDGSGGRKAASSAIVTFGPFGASPVANITHVMLMDDATAAAPANMKAWAALDTARQPNAGDSLSFAVG